MEGLFALCISTAICFTATTVTSRLGATGQTLTLITALTVAVATLFPRRLEPIIPSAEGLAAILMQVRLAAGGWSMMLFKRQE
jgi:hypothetical protein